MVTSSLPSTAVPFSEIYITDQLAVRPPRSVNTQREKAALQDLTVRMSRAPEEVLPRFVELAMELTGSVSAGLSLLEDPKTFRWRNLCGTLSVFEGACTPRDDSPCGITLNENRPVLTRYSISCRCDQSGVRWIVSLIDTLALSGCVARISVRPQKGPPELEATAGQFGFGDHERM